MTLRAYFPDAVIVGSEVQKERLKICRGLQVDHDIIFIDASKQSLSDNGPYDAIFCMAVLQRVPHLVIDEKILNIGRLYSFQKFDDQLSELDVYLKPGGMLFIKHSHYRFCDATIAKNYKTVLEDNTETTSLMFDTQSNFIEGNGYVDIGFRKLR